jgi:hypothetical protein
MCPITFQVLPNCCITEKRRDVPEATISLALRQKPECQLFPRLVNHSLRNRPGRQAVRLHRLRNVMTCSILVANSSLLLVSQPQATPVSRATPGVHSVCLESYSRRLVFQIGDPLKPCGSLGISLLF